MNIKALMKTFKKCPTCDESQPSSEAYDGIFPVRKTKHNDGDGDADYSGRNE
jgi:hypothetical protein